MRRACQLMKQDSNQDARAQGGIDLPTIQKWINHWYGYSLDLFGAEVSTNAADYFASGVKGRWQESKDYEDHNCLGAKRSVPTVENGTLIDKQYDLRNCMNEELRDSYAKDCHRVLRRWNKAVADEGITDFEFTLPSTRFFGVKVSTRITTSTATATSSMRQPGRPTRMTGCPPMTTAPTSRA